VAGFGWGVVVVFVVTVLVVVVWPTGSAMGALVFIWAEHPATMPAALVNFKIVVIRELI
jgi:hypothetical protein